jgi:hypothetical protein
MGFGEITAIALVCATFLVLGQRFMVHRERMAAIEQDRPWAFPKTAYQAIQEAVAEQEDPKRKLADELVEAYDEAGQHIKNDD